MLETIVAELEHIRDLVEHLRNLIVSHRLSSMS
jgi:hypothetical protein